MVRVLVVDGDPAVRASLTSALSGAGHDVESASSGTAGLAIARASRPQVVIFDLALSDIGGLELARSIRRDITSGAPLLVVLSAQTGEDDRVAAFEAGVDDYVMKPHSTRELLLRVRALSRRKSDPPKVESLKIGGLRIDVAARQAWNEKDRVDLTRREFDVLLMLAERAGRVQTREVLVADIWGDDVSHSGRIVDTTIKRLRRKIATAGCEIKTVRGVGYKLVSSSDDT
jgi:two-component system, OmpR family, phosphate regulon response regulator PhoB